MRFDPAVYEHAAALIGKTPNQVSRDAELLFQAHAKAFTLYGHSPVVPGIDIYNLEAEAYGATVDTPGGNGIPAISSYPCSNLAEVRHLTPLNPKQAKRIPMILATGKRLAQAYPAAIVRIPVSGPFSLAGNLVGFDTLLCEIMDDPASARTTLRHLAQGQLAYCREITDQGLGITFFESGATPPLISPEIFAEVEQPALTFMMDSIRSLTGEPPPCIIGGNTLPILDSILATGTGYVICPCETDQPSFMRKMEQYPDIMVRINMRADAFTTGDQTELYSELDRVMSLARNRKNVCIGGGVLPFNANPELVLKAGTYVRKDDGMAY